MNTFVSYISEGAALGLTLGTTCAATCGPMYMPYLMQTKNSFLKNILKILEISAGRFLSYIAFGMLAGSLGSAIGMVLNRGWFSSIAYILFSVLLLISAFRARKKEKGGCSVSKWSKFIDRPFLFGMVTGISLCPSFFGAMTAAFDTGGFTGGGAIFAGFFVGSSLFLFPFVIAGIAGNIKVFRKIATAASVVVAAYFIGKGTSGLITLANQVQTPKSEISADNIVGILDSLPLYVIADSTTSSSLLEVFSAKKTGPVYPFQNSEILPEKCHIMIQEGMYDSTANLRQAGRFVVVLPRQKEEHSTLEFANHIVTYFNKYMFKRDDENGTFFNMATFLNKKKNRHDDHSTCNDG